MLAMGRALMSRPKLLMLDEPSMGLAPILVQQIFDIIKELHKAGTTILLVEQNAQMALSVADRAYVMESGRIVLSGTGAELASKLGGFQRLRFEVTEQATATSETAAAAIRYQPGASTLPLVNGSATSERYLLPEGTYQLVWTVPSGPKQRSFRVDCDQRTDSRPSPAETVLGTDYRKPSGAVPAGGGGVPDMENLSAEEDSGVGTTAALTAGAAGIAALVMVRRSARRRARSEA